MKDLIIGKSCFICSEANKKTKKRVMDHVINKTKKLPINRYRLRYKTAIIPIMSSVFLLGGYLAYQNTSIQNPVQTDIAETKTTINELITMIDNEKF